MKDFYFLVLEKAEKRGLLNAINISNELKYCLKQSPFYLNPPEKWYELPGMLLKPLQDKGYILYTEVNYNTNIKPKPKEWINQLDAIITITPEGLLFLYQRQSAKSVSSGVLISKISIWVTGFIAISALIVSIANYKISANSNKENVTLLQSQIQEQNKMLQLKQLQIDSLILKTAHLPDKASPLKR